MGLPPTSSKGDLESGFGTTFKTDYDEIPVTRTGVEIKIGTTPISMGGTGSTTKNFVDLTTNQTIAGVKTFSSTIAGSVSGNSATVTTNANLTGEVTSIGNAATITNDAVIAKTLTGYVAAPGVIAPADTILTALQKVDGNVTAKTLQNVYEASTSPQVVTSATKGALNLKRGSALDSDAVLKVLNGAGDDVASIDGLGNLKANNVVITNYIQDPKCERVITTAIPYNTRVGTPAIDKNPTTGVGGSSSLTVSNSTSVPLSGLRSLLVVKPASDIQGHGFSIPFTIERTQINKPLQISMYYEIASGTYADGDLTWWVIPDGANPIQPAPTKLMNVVGVENFFGEFQTTSALSYKLVCHVSSQSALAFSLKFDNFFCGRGARASVSPITDWEPCRFSTLAWQGLGNVTNQSLECKKEGSDLIIRGRFDSGTVTGSIVRIPIPNNFGASTAKSFAASSSYGDIKKLSGTAGSLFNTIAVSISNYFEIGGPLASAANNPNNAITGTVMGTGEAFVLDNLRIPILGWSSSTLMSSDADTRLTSALVIRGTSAQSLTAGSWQKIQFNSISSDTHGTFDSVTNYRYVIPSAGEYDLGGILNFSPAASSAQIDVAVYLNGSIVKSAVSMTSTGYYGISPNFKLPNLKAGNYIEIYIYPAVAATLLSSASIVGGSQFWFTKISGSAQIAASESVSALYRGAPPVSATLSGTPTVIKFGTKVKDSHGTYNTSTGEYEITQPGTYDIASQVIIQGTFSSSMSTALHINVDGVDVSSFILYSKTATFPDAMITPVSIASLPLLVGQKVKIMGAAAGITSPVFNSTSAYNYFSITRTGNY